MKYYKIANADGKVWVMPQKNMRLGMMLYQPSAWKGYLFKKLFPYLSWCKPVRMALHIELVQNPIPVEMRHKLEDVFGISNLEYSYFGGTPGVHRKVSIQIYKDGRILGYCKTTTNRDIYALFKHEEMILNELNRRKVKGIPLCIYSGEWKAGEFLFVQTTVKTIKSKIVHELDSVVSSFLSHLKRQTLVSCRFEETDEYEWLCRLEMNIYKLSKEEQIVVCKGIDNVKMFFKDKEHSFSAYHGDYTPWNMFVEKETLFVFDFEYAGMRYIPYLDIMHHFTQTGIFEKGWDADVAYKTFLDEKVSLTTYYTDSEIAFIAYLLDQLAKYLSREITVSSDTQQKLDIWIPLLSKLIK